MSLSDFDEVELIGVTRLFGRRRALHKVNLTCQAGQVLGVFGHNGAGKSTLLLVLATLLAPTTGTVRFGRHLKADASLRRAIGFLAHEPHLYPELSALENLIFFASLSGLQNPHEAADAAIARAGLTERGGDLVGSYSRGMRQRVALERALIHEPRLVLLDEPFAGLDEAARTSLVMRIRDLKQLGVIVVLASHERALLESFVDRIVVLEHGRVEPPSQERCA